MARRLKWTLAELRSHDIQTIADLRTILEYEDGIGAANDQEG